MNLECLNTIIKDNLAIHIDLTNLKSWDLNTGLTSISLTKWKNAISDNINLIDFGLTEFDNGRTNIMWSGITLTPDDTKLTLYRIGKNIVYNPTSGQTTGVTVITDFNSYPISAITSGNTGNYFDLHGGYLQGFFKLDGFKFEQFPSRYNEGITIENLLLLNENSKGIFYMMGVRAEDKYNPFFSGETLTANTTVTGVNTSFDNYLDAILEKKVIKKAFSLVENNETEIFEIAPQINNLKNNVIAFEITNDKKFAYKYINNEGEIITNTSNRKISPSTGWTLITIVFTPNYVFDDVALLNCDNQRKGELIFYVNGRPIWILKEFPEFFFKRIINDKEKQIGVPYSISWGGGSFGLKNSWHYDYFRQKRPMDCFG